MVNISIEIDNIDKVCQQKPIPWISILLTLESNLFREYKQRQHDHGWDIGKNLPLSIKYIAIERLHVFWTA